jgi:hypothetical protein
LSPAFRGLRHNAQERDPPGGHDETAIAEVLRRAGTAAEACRELVDRALANGGRDNVTVVLGRYSIPQGGQTLASVS